MFEAPTDISTAQAGRFKRSKSVFVWMAIGLIMVPCLYWANLISIQTVNRLGYYATYAILALSLDLIWGYAGILGLCQATFFCIGGYAMGMYLAHHGGPEGTIDPNNWKIPACLYVVYPGKVGQLPSEWLVPWFWKPFWTLPVTIILGLVLPAVVAFVIGYAGFKSRVRGVYFAILAQAIAVAAFNFFSMNNMKLCGTNGLTRFERIAGDFRLDSPNVTLSLYVITVAGLFAAYALCGAVTRSRFGRVLVAIRDDENTLRFSGYTPYTYKLFAFCLAAAIAGFAGMLYVPQMGIITPFDMDAGKSILVVIWVAVGGRGSLSGAILGALAINLLENFLTSQHDFIFFTWQPDYWQFVLGGLFVIVVLVLPDGLISLWRRLCCRIFRSPNQRGER
tara:strand:+ start:155 stop:1333 length:1179 start_codon:yes stop_codon:yes gene_type:complete